MKRKKRRLKKMRTLRKVTYEYDISSEAESTATIEEYKTNALEKGYMVTNSKVDYKVKKDRKTGDIVDENWVTKVTITYDI